MYIYIYIYIYICIYSHTQFYLDFEACQGCIGATSHLVTIF